MRWKDDGMQIELSTHRIEALTDGLFAIVMTLIVLELKVPEIPKPVNDGEMLRKLAELGPHLFTFGLTFVLSGAFWFQHHMSLQQLRHMTRMLIWVNLAFLLFVSVLPFSAGLLGRYPFSRVAQMVYYGNQFAIGLPLAAQWAYAGKKGLIRDSLSPRLRYRLSGRLWLMPVATLAAFAGAAWRPAYAAYGFAIVIVLGRLIMRRRERKLAAEPLSG